MKKYVLMALLWLLPGGGLFGGINLTPWTPVFKGIDRIVGTNTPDGDIPRLQVANCMRIDLRDPDVVLFPTPPASNAVVGTSLETTTLTVSNYLKVYGLAVATDCNFYDATPGGSNPTSENLPCRVYGLQVCTGAVVSIPDSGPDSNGRYCSLLFGTNKEASTAFNTYRPGAELPPGIFTAVSGYYPVLSNGLNIAEEAIASFPDPTIHGSQPRTLFGLSQDRRYLFLATIDGRQPGYSDGAIDNESAIWMVMFGASDAVNMDGGGSTAMYMADCAGDPVAVNHSSFTFTVNPPRERIIGSHLGIYAKPLPSDLRNLNVQPGLTTAIITWETDDPATTQVAYGPTASLGSATPLETQPKRSHVATVSGLNAGTTYFFRAISVSGAQTLTSGCSFRTTNTASANTLVFDVTSSWKYTTNNQDSTTWKLRSFDDANWSGPGQGLLYIENNSLVTPRNTLLPPGASPVMRTYYFRKHFAFTGSKAGVSIILSNYLDDGAVFYLNGAELQRLRMPNAPVTISYSTAASAQPCTGGAAGDAICSDVLTISSATLVNNLLEGDNVLAVEVHNFGTSTDIVFGTALLLGRTQVAVPELFIERENEFITLSWNGEGYTLERSSDLSSAGWGDVPGPVTRSPLTVQNSGSVFYRLRQ
jgi:hypothetical protein